MLCIKTEKQCLSKTEEFPKSRKSLEKHGSSTIISFGKFIKSWPFWKNGIYILKEETSAHLSIIKSPLRLFFEKMGFCKGGGGLMHSQKLL